MNYWLKQIETKLVRALSTMHWLNIPSPFVRVWLDWYREIHGPLAGIFDRLLLAVENDWWTNRVVATIWNVSPDRSTQTTSRRTGQCAFDIQFRPAVCPIWTLVPAPPSRHRHTQRPLSVAAIFSGGTHYPGNCLIDWSKRRRSDSSPPCPWFESLPKIVTYQLGHSWRIRSAFDTWWLCRLDLVDSLV